MTIADATPPQYLIERSVRVQPRRNPESITTPVAKSTHVMTFAMQDLAAPWLRDAMDRISDLTALAMNWDSYGARPVEADLALQAVTFLMRVAFEEVPEPSIVPLGDGGIQLEWHVAGIDLEIAFSEEEPGVYFASADQEMESPLNEAERAIRALVAGTPAAA
ncbi:MAG TPA: hypothetical protein VNS09_05100 [Solirubrobacter sp.]|nr:hypothetical protein [Solirubrobacter sp.]